MTINHESSSEKDAPSQTAAHLEESAELGDNNAPQTQAGSLMSQTHKMPTTHSETPTGIEGLWEDHASWWQDEFTDGIDPEYVEQIIPIVKELTAGYQQILDIGTGEGQIAREMLQNGARKVWGIDPTHAQIHIAAQRGGAALYARASADAISFKSNTFDAAVACLVFEHIENMDEAINEVARVLKPGGRFVFLLNHPLLQTPEAGWIQDYTVDPPEHYWRIGSYLSETLTVEEVQKDVYIPFVHRPLSRYLNAIATAGLRFVQMLEPPPPPGFLKNCPEYGHGGAIPRLLVLVAEKDSC